MLTQINAYLRFNGNCREAMCFYQECLGGELNLQTVGGSPIEMHIQCGAKDSILHAVLIKDAMVLLASDMTGPEGAVRGNTMSLCLDCSSEQEIETFYAKLAAGGKATHPPMEAFWGGKFGDLIDKFGNSWILNYSATQ